MRRCVRCALLPCLILLGLPFLFFDGWVAGAADRGIVPASGSSRVALVMGNSDYASAPLSNPLNDAHDLAEVLRALDFAVIEECDADRRRMITAIDSFYELLLGAEIGLFYFAGHGIQIQNRNYLIPVDTHITTETDVPFEAVDAGRVLGKMKEAGNRLNIVILDACRNNPFKRSFRTTRQGLAQMDAPKGTIVAYATSPGSVAAEGEGRNGVYTKHLLLNIGARGMSIQDVLMETGLGVMRETGDRQVPWISSTPVPRYCLAGEIEAPTRSRKTFPPGSDALSSVKDSSIRESSSVEKEGNGLPAKTASLQGGHSAPISPPEDKAIVTTDRSFELYANGIFLEREKGLEWYLSPSIMTWKEAEEWVDHLSLDGGGWRFPTFEELKSMCGNKPAFLRLEGTSWIWAGKRKAWIGENVYWFDYHGKQAKVTQNLRHLKYVFVVRDAP